MITAAYIQIKPLSVNQAWKGRRYKTPEYQQYEMILGAKLGVCKKISDAPLRVTITWGFSNAKNSDIDNPIKPFLDVLQKKYGFNDNQIWELHVSKEKVPKGKEFIKFSIEEL